MSDTTCEMCKKIFPSQCHLKRHLGRTIPCIGNNFNCDYCNNSYTTKSGLKNHINDNCVEYIKSKETKNNDAIKESIILPHQSNKITVNNVEKTRKVKILPNNDIVIKLLKEETSDNCLIIDELQNKNLLNELATKQIKDLQNELLIKDSQIEELQNVLSIKDSQIKELQNDNLRYKATINDVETKIKNIEIKIEDIETPHLKNKNEIIDDDKTDKQNNSNPYTSAKIIKSLEQEKPIIPIFNDIIMDCDVENSCKIIKYNNKGIRKTLKNKKIAYVKLLLELNNDDKLIKYIGNVVIKVYQNDTINPSNVTRFTFLANVLNATCANSNWFKNKAKEELKNLAITPILSYITKVLQKIQTIPNLNLNFTEIYKTLNDMNIMDKIVKHIAIQFR